MVWPVSPWKLPAGQASHDVAPDEVPHLPAVQDVQEVAPAAEYLPAAHESVQSAVKPVDVPYFPAVQSSPPPLPVEVSYFPEGQVVQSESTPVPVVLYVPALHEPQK